MLWKLFFTVTVWHFPPCCAGSNFSFFLSTNLKIKFFSSTKAISLRGDEFYTECFSLVAPAAFFPSFICLFCWQCASGPSVMWWCVWVTPQPSESQLTTSKQEICQYFLPISSIGNEPILSLGNEPTFSQYWAILQDRINCTARMWISIESVLHKGTHNCPISFFC